MAKPVSMSAACRKKLNTLFRSLPEDVKSHGRKTQYYVEVIFDKLMENGAFASDDLVTYSGKSALVFGAKFLNLGKASVDPALQGYKPDLTGEALNTYRSHVENGLSLFDSVVKIDAFEEEKDAFFYKVVRNCIKDHHECFDGSGYPEGKCASQISLPGRICAVANAFDFYVSGSDSADAISFDAAFELVNKSSCEMFDPTVVSALEECLPQIAADDQNGKITKAAEGRKTLRAIELLYRPVYDYNNRTTYGYQTKLRLNDKKLGQVYYDVLLPVAEKSNKINELSKWAIEEACEACVRLDKRDRFVGMLFIDLSIKSLNKRFFIDNIVKIITGYELNPENFCFVLPENDLSPDTSKAAAAISALHSHGFKVALDGFGSQYSNIASLEELDVDYAMISADFVKNVLTSNRAKKICDSLIDMANKLDILVIADGIENKELANSIFASNCALMRGDHFGKYAAESSI